MFRLLSDEMMALRPNESLIFSFYGSLSNSIQNWTTFVKDFFELMLSSESDEMTAV